MITIIHAAGYSYLHAGTPPVVRRIDDVPDSALPSLFQSVIDELNSRSRGYIRCKYCASPITRRSNESITSYRKRQFCSKGCANHARVPLRRRKPQNKS